GFLPLDVSNSQSIREAASEFPSISDRLDVLINNAGIYPDEGATIASIPRERVNWCKRFRQIPLARLRSLKPSCLICDVPERRGSSMCRVATANSMCPGWVLTGMG